MPGVARKILKTLMEFFFQNGFPKKIQSIWSSRFASCSLHIQGVPEKKLP